MRRSGVGGAAPPMRRLRRRLGMERNELRRRVDRVQRAIALALLVLLLAAAPPVAAWCGGLAYEAGLRAERHEHAQRQEVWATVVATGGIGSAGDRYVHETVQATWPRPADGRTRTGTLPSWKGAAVGARKQIWVDRDGRLAVRPRPHSRTVTDAVYAGGAAALGVGAPVLLAYVVVRRRCDRHRDRMWDAAWARMDTDAGHNRPS
ncbi:Rv1733c family protein [Actinomadura miaoliensis]|uniref:DUF3592 domain-containing protein n=1 Tax=Actinomadura miaoliensis TaxID=430685 RepID=A0ABP7VGU7_9ACTN